MNENNPPKKKSKKGCLKIVLISISAIFIIGLIASIFDDDKKSTNDDVNKKKDILVTNDKINKEKKDSLISLGKKELDKFRQEKDEFRNLIFYSDKSTPIYINQNFVYCYIAEQDSYYSLRLKMQYTSDDWLFINKVYINIDGKNVWSGNLKFERDNDSRIWEWIDLPVKETFIPILTNIAKGKVVKIRYEGSHYYKDIILTQKEKQAIDRTLKVYLYLNGEEYQK